MIPGVTIGRNHLFLFLGTLLVLGSIFFVAAYNSNPGNPSVLGHTANEIGPGTINALLFGGSATFNGNPNTWYNFPGYVTIGPKSFDQSNLHALQVYDPDDSAGIVMESGVPGNGAAPNNVYLDFLTGGVLKANIDYNTGRLLINGNPATEDTNVAIGTSSPTSDAKLGVGKDATTHRVEVRGNVQADGFCIGASCLSSWPGAASVLIDSASSGTIATAPNAGGSGDNCIGMGSPVITTYTAPFTIASVFLRYRDSLSTSPAVNTMQPVLLTSLDTSWRLVYSGAGGTSSPTNIAARISGNAIEFCRDYDASGWSAGTHSVDIVAFGQ